MTHVELSRSIGAILNMPQYVVYQKNVAYAFIMFIKLSAKARSFSILCTIDVLSYTCYCIILKSYLYSRVARALPGLPAHPEHQHEEESN